MWTLGKTSHGFAPSSSRDCGAVQARGVARPGGSPPIRVVTCHKKESRIGCRNGRQFMWVDKEPVIFASRVAPLNTYLVA